MVSILNALFTFTAAINLVVKSLKHSNKIMSFVTEPVKMITAFAKKSVKGYSVRLMCLLSIEPFL